jgi:uncharacterized protein
MSKDNLPIQVNPFRLAENATTLHGHLLVKDMPRLCSSLLTEEGEVDVKLVFGIEHKVRFLKGFFKTALTLQCQRCMEPFLREITADFAMGLVTSEEAAKRLPEECEPLIITDESLIIPDMIEDELILSLPIVPTHAENDCRVKLPIFASDNKDDEKESPFKVIEFLKAKTKQE